MKNWGFVIMLLFTGLMFRLDAQNIQVAPSENGTGVYLGKTRPLRDIPELTNEDKRLLKSKAESKQFNGELSVRQYPFASTALPKGSDAVWQNTLGTAAPDRAPERNFEGQSTSASPPDCNGTVGPNHYMQMVNSTFAVYDKSGTKLAGPSKLSLLFNGVPGADCDDGDPIILYDEQADRWVAGEFSLCGANDRMLISVSTTGDPTGTWNAYSFDVADVPDYPKLSVWQDGYYMGDNNDTGKDIYVFERSKMIAGAPDPQFVGFNNAWRPGSTDGFMCVPPVDNDGPFAPAGSPGLFIAMSDDAFNGATDQLWIYELYANWSLPSDSYFSRIQQIDVEPFDSNFGTTWRNIRQLGTTQKLDAVPQVIMNVPQYRNFGTYQTIVCCHAVDVDKTDHAGIRWYELRKTPPSTTWIVRQQGTYAPDSHSRWMGSIMLNSKNELGLGYSISSTKLNPGIRYCGQTEAEYNKASGILDFQEAIIHSGTLSQTGTERWGDYSQMSVDPADDGTFWFTSQYVGAGVRKTKIASFQVSPVIPVAYFDADNTLPCVNNTIVKFKSIATGNPTHYLWEFSPSSVTFADTTSSSSLNPKVIFNALGAYTVSLTLTGEGGTKTTTKTNYINVNEAVVYFTASATSVVVNSPLSFMDTSSCGVTSWQWDFGEGASPATANTQGPHTVLYSTTGLKTVSLTVNGKFTITKTGYLSIIDSDVNMSSTTVSACGGTFYDPGGPASDYGNNQDYSMLFTPSSPGNILQLNFISFNLGAGEYCVRDYLKIYNGTSVSAPLIGTFCGTGSPGIVKGVNTSGALFFVFHSDTSHANVGWAATISCVPDRAENPVSFTAAPLSNYQISLEIIKNSGKNEVMVAWSLDGIFGTPVSGTQYNYLEVIPGGGEILSVMNEPGTVHGFLSAATTYYYKAFSITNDKIYSSGIPANATTLIQPVLIDPVKGSTGISLYPNPAKGVFSLVADKSKYPLIHINITDVNGKTVISRVCIGESEYIFDLSKSPQGTYFVKINTDKESTVRKLVIIK